MRSWKKVLEKMLSPKEIQLQDVSLEDIEKYLTQPVIFKKWMNRLINKLQMINLEIDNLLAKEDKTRIWESLAIERRTILRMLTMVMDIKEEMDAERLDQEARQRINEKFANQIYAQGEQETALDDIRRG